MRSFHRMLNILRENSKNEIKRLSLFLERDKLWEKQQWLLSKIYKGTLDVHYPKIYISLP